MSGLVKPRTTYRSVVGFAAYRVGSDGSVWKWFDRFGNCYWRRMKGNKGAQGYVGVKLRKDGIGHGRFVHRLVLEAFVGPCPEGMEACHWDDNKENNNLWNLRWDTPKGNYRDAIRNGKMPLGETHGMSKLTETDVRFIRRNYPIGRAWDRQLKQRRVSLAARFGVTTALLGLIYKGKIWRHLAW